MSKRIALAFGLTCAIIIAALLILLSRREAMKRGCGGNGFGESRAVPAPMIDETEAPLPLQIDTNKPATVSFKTNISL